METQEARLARLEKKVREMEPIIQIYANRNVVFIFIAVMTVFNLILLLLLK